MQILNHLNNNQFWSIGSKHLLGWALFIGYELIYVLVMTGALRDPYSYLLHYTINIFIFYFNAHILLPYSTGKLKGAAIATIFLVIAEIAVFIGVKYLAVVFIRGERPNLEGEGAITKYIISNGMRIIYIMGFSTAYWFALITINRNKKLAKLETARLLEQNEKILLQKDLLQSRNAYLQAQVNPHLLFNTLNFLYNASAQVSEKLAETVMSLSDIMRYALTSIDDDDKVPLEKEIEHIHNYIRLNQVRFDEKLNVDLFIQGDPKGLRIIPLALITLVENVFQYGDLHNPQSPVEIILNITSGELIMELKNSKRASRRIHGHGTGVRNLRERLDIYYPNAYLIEINDQENSYQLKLTITLN